MVIVWSMTVLTYTNKECVPLYIKLDSHFSVLLINKLTKLVYLKYVQAMVYNIRIANYGRGMGLPKPWRSQLQRHQPMYTALQSFFPFPTEQLTQRIKENNNKNLPTNFESFLNTLLLYKFHSLSVSLWRIWVKERVKVKGGCQFQGKVCK